LDKRCVVVAPTGVAASNIEGHTIHSMFSIPVQEFKSLCADSLLDLQEKWNGIEYIIVDEISMVGQTLMGKIDSRLRQIFPSKAHSVFGGCSMIMLGDFGQLPPVMDSSLFSPEKPKSDLAMQGRLAYLSVSSAFFLSKVMRQDGDTAFRDLLLRLRNGEVNLQDWKMLCTRDDTGGISSTTSFQQSLYLFPTRLAVLQHNIIQLKRSGNNAAIFNAVHPPSSKHSAQAGSDDAGGLEQQLALSNNAKVMLTQNLWVDCGLVNGTVGYVKAIIYEQGTRPPQLPQVVLVHFPAYTGPVMNGNVIPIVPRTFHWMHKNKHHCARTQIPLTLSWATTIHKSQGLTLDTAIVNIGSKELCAGLTYVALSRVRQLSHLCIYPVNYDRLLKISKCSALNDRKQEEKRLSLFTKF
jgi:ATP-dependent DNA helicase PIF1